MGIQTFHISFLFFYQLLLISVNRLVTSVSKFQNVGSNSEICFANCVVVLNKMFFGVQYFKYHIRLSTINNFQYVGQFTL